MMIKLDIVEAQGLAADPNLASPYGVLAAGTDRFKTQLQAGIDPIWEEGFDVDIEQAQNVCVTIWNKQPGQDVFLGLASIDLDTIPLDGSKNWFTLVGRRGKDDDVSGEVCIACTAYDDLPPPRPLDNLPPPRRPQMQAPDNDAVIQTPAKNH
jgi:hypothetical protein